MTPRFSLSAHERLKSRKLISRVFEEGQSRFIYPFKLFYLKLERLQDEGSLQFTVAVPRKKIRSAVTRNLIKRRTREAYRLNKAPLQDLLRPGKTRLALIFVYLDADAKNFTVIEKSIKQHLENLSGNMAADPSLPA